MFNSYNFSLNRERELYNLRVESLEDENETLRKKIVDLRQEIQGLHRLQFYWKKVVTIGRSLITMTSQSSWIQLFYKMTSLLGDSQHRTTTGGSCVYTPRKDNFTASVRWSSGGALTPDFTKQNNWHIAYTIISLDHS